MACFTWRRLGCFILVQLAALAGCAPAANQQTAPVVHLIIPEDFRGLLEIQEIADPFGEPKSGEWRIEVSDHGFCEIDSHARLRDYPVKATFTDGTPLKTHDLSAREIGFRSAVVFREHNNAPTAEFFVGTQEEFDDYLADHYADWQKRLEQRPNRIEQMVTSEVFARSDISTDDLKDMPIWRGKGKPPLDLEAAVTIANHALRGDKILPMNGLTPELDRAALVNAHFIPGEHWYWRLHYTYMSGGMSGIPCMIEIVVFMNGRILPPKFVEAFGY